MKTTPHLPTVTLLELVDQVDQQQLRVLWVTDDATTAQALARELQRHVDEQRIANGRVRVSSGREAYVHRDGGRILFAPASKNLHWIRGHVIDLVAAESSPNTWSQHFLADVEVLLATGSRLAWAQRVAG
jgi:hypothetical protein